MNGTAPDPATVVAVRNWADSVVERFYAAMRRRRVEACPHVVDIAIGADVAADLGDAGDALLPGAGQIPPPRLCGIHLGLVACWECSEAHVQHHAAARYRRCQICGSTYGVEGRYLELHLQSPLAIVNRSVGASIMGMILLDPALILCREHGDRMPQSEFDPLPVAPVQPERRS